MYNDIIAYEKCRPARIKYTELYESLGAMTRVHLSILLFTCIFTNLDYYRHTTNVLKMTKAYRFYL